jgi:hypothetical protein
VICWAIWKGYKILINLADLNAQERGFEENKLASFIADQVQARASGRDAEDCHLNLPRDRYFIGNLRPAPQEDDDTSLFRPSSEFLNKLSPVAFGAEFRVYPKTASFKVHVRLRWSCYYRVFPTFQQQLEFQKRQTIESEEDYKQQQALATNQSLAETPVETDDNHKTDESPEVTETPKDRRKSRIPTDTLYIHFKKIRCEATGYIRVDINSNTQEVEWKFDKDNLQAAVSEEVKRAQKIVLSDPAHLKTMGDPKDTIRVPENVLSDLTGKSFTAFCKALQIDVIPEWQWTITPSARIADILSSDLKERVLSLEFTNTSPMLEQDRNVEPFLFETEASFSFDVVDCLIVPFEFELAPRGFRYNVYRHVVARGFNCNVTYNGSGDFYITDNIPIFSQRRYRTQSQPLAAFADLAKNPIPVLEKILRSMEDYLDAWSDQNNVYTAQEWWTPDFQEEFERGINQYQEEIERFSTGLELIKSNPDVQAAFKLTNETFNRLPKEEKTSWRLFQIVFLVIQIPGIAALADPTSLYTEDRDKVDIIYFPTGGGKTEAYLSVIVFHCFFDRLRGKSAGVTAWTRFPLRLLTLQQTQRVADIIGLAELVRKEQTKELRLTKKGVAGFAVGYFVGSNATPNKLSPPQRGNNNDPEWVIAQDDKARQQWKRIVRCPSCRTNSIVVDFDEEAVRLRHRCTRPDCKFENGYLPIYVVDNEVYRYLPAVIVGTIDKLAGIGNQSKMSLLFGRVDGYCQIHGYFAGKCCQDECNDSKRLKRDVPQGLSGPTMFIQDELHLLKEGLGTFDAHYETFVQKMIQELKQEYPLKIIASSATIEAFERQVEHLYGRNPKEARVFPGQGPTLTESFYAETLNFPQRLFLGIIPHNKTIFNAILELVQYYHEILQELQRIPYGELSPYDGVIVPGTHDWASLLDYYATSLVYFLNTRELYSVKTDLDGDTNPNLEQASYRALEIAELTGSVSASDVSTTLERIERHNPKPGEAPDIILATNMISHGVDVERLNAMIFYGMPAQVAEYIQASSRVGRTHVGLVFMCLHPARERDQSHYEYFPKFHEFLGQLVEPVAINRWSRFSITRTLPGLFMAILLQLIAGTSNDDKDKSRGRYTRLDFVKKQIRDGKIRSEQFIPILEEAYRVSGIDSPGTNAFREEIRIRVNEFFDQILGAGPHVEWVSEALLPQPMRSLRDVDEQLPVELDENGTRWATRN